MKFGRNMSTKVGQIDLIKISNECVTNHTLNVQMICKCCHSALAWKQKETSLHGLFSSPSELIFI